MGRRNDARARQFDELYCAHLSAVADYAARRCDEADAVDVVAETFATAWRRFDEMPTGSDARPWLYGVARRVVANHHRGSRRRNALSERMRQEWRPKHSPPPSTALGPLQRALEELSDDDREILMLAGVEERSTPEIAVDLELTPEATRSCLSRARSRLREKLNTETAAAASTPKEAS